MLYWLNHDTLKRFQYAYKDVSFLGFSRSKCPQCNRQIGISEYRHEVPHLLLEGGAVYPDYLQFCGLRLKWPKYWNFNFSISPSNEHQGLISFRTEWLDLLAVQGTLKILLQHHSSKASILWRSAFFTVPLEKTLMLRKIEGGRRRG